MSKEPNITVYDFDASAILSRAKQEAWGKWVAGQEWGDPVQDWHHILGVNEMQVWEAGTPGHGGLIVSMPLSNVPKCFQAFVRSKISVNSVVRKGWAILSFEEDCDWAVAMRYVPFLLDAYNAQRKARGMSPIPMDEVERCVKRWNPELMEKERRGWE